MCVRVYLTASIVWIMCFLNDVDVIVCIVAYVRRSLRVCKLFSSEIVHETIFIAHSAIHLKNATFFRQYFIAAKISWYSWNILSAKSKQISVSASNIIVGSFAEMWLIELRLINISMWHFQEPYKIKYLNSLASNIMVVIIY